MTRCESRSDCQQNYYCDGGSGYCETCDHICKPSKGLPNYCKQECPDYSNTKTPDTPGVSLISIPTSVLYATTSSLIPLDTGQSPGTNHSTPILIIFFILLSLVILMVMLLIFIIRYYVVNNDKHNKNKKIKLMCCICKEAPNIQNTIDGIQIDERTGNVEQEPEVQQELHPYSLKDKQQKYSGGEISSMQLESNLQNTSDNIIKSNSQHKKTVGTSQNSQEETEFKSMGINTEICSYKSNTDVQNKNTEVQIKSKGKEFSKNGKPQEKLTTSATQNVPNMHNNDKRDNPKFSSIHTQTDQPDKPICSTIETQTNDVLFDLDHYSTTVPKVNNYNIQMLRPGHLPPHVTETNVGNMLNGAENNDDIKKREAKNAEEAFKSITVKPRFKHNEQAVDVIQRTIEPREQFDSNAGDESDENTNIKEVDRLTVAQQETTPLFDQNIQAGASAILPNPPLFAPSQAFQGEPVPSPYYMPAQQPTRQSFDVVPRPQLTQQELRRIHPNRKIYDTLKQIPWIQGYFSEGQSIEVYVDLDEISINEATAQLVQRTGERPEKFKVVQNEPVEYNSMQFAHLI